MKSCFNVSQGALTVWRRGLTVLAAAAIMSTSMVGAPALAQSSSRNLANEEANRQLVVKFYDEFFNDHRVAESSKVVAEDYKQHNPDVPDGKQPFVSYFEGFFEKNPGSRAKIVRSSTDGDLVWLHVHSTNDAKDRGQAVVDLFRVKDGMIVEHWDVVQDVPVPSANKNTMF